jgi:thiol-disulfide isomerase/thioredoxin
MNKTTILAAASAAALLSTIPAFAQGNGFVTLDLNWTETAAPAEEENDGDAMKQMLERDRARAQWIQERTKAKAPAIKPELVKDDAPKADEAKTDAPKTTTITVPLTNSGNTLTSDQMRQILERDQARAQWIQERMKTAQEKAEQEKKDAPKTGTVPGDVTLRPTTVTTPVAPPDSTRPATRTFTSDQMRQILERDRARAQAMGERIRAAQVEAEAEKYLKEHDIEFTPGKTLPGWTDNFTAAVGKAKAEKKPILALFTGSDWCGPCQNLEKNILIQPSFKDFAKRHLVTLFLDFPQKTELDDGVKKQNDDLAKKFSVEAYPTILVLSSDGEKELWKQVGYTALFLEKLQEGLMGLDKDFPEVAKALKDAKEAEAKAKEEKAKAELEEFERQQKEQEDLEKAWDQYSSPGIIDPATANRNPWGTGRIRRQGGNPLDNLSDEEREALFRELDKNGPIQGPDVLPNGGPAPLRPSVKRD